MNEPAGAQPNPHPGIEVIEVDIDRIHSAQALVSMAPAERAQIALNTSKTEAALVALAAKNTGIVEIKDKAGRDQAHGAAMELMRTRTTIADLSKKARDDATKFSKAVIAEETRLIAIIEPEEKRLKALRDGWDEEQERIKREKAEAERKRLLAISEQISAIKNYANLASQCRTSARVQELIDRLTAVEVTPEIYAEFTDDAAAEKSATLIRMGGYLKVKQDQEAEAKRLADERAEQERVRQEQAERQRQLDEQAAELARQQKALQDAQAAAAAPPPLAPSTAANTNPVNEAGIPAADAAALNATAQTLVLATDTTVIPLTQGGDTGPVVTHAHTPTPVVAQTAAPVTHKATRPSDDEIIDALALHFRVHESKVVEWLLDMDLQAASDRLAGEFA